LDYIGEQLIAQVEVEIGGQRIDRQYGDWMHIWNQLTLSSEQQRGYFKMIGNTTQLTYITDPLFAEVSGPCISLALFVSALIQNNLNVLIFNIISSLLQPPRPSF
jgi:Major capsid protein N-terminus